MCVLCKPKISKPLPSLNSSTEQDLNLALAGMDAVPPTVENFKTDSLKIGSNQVLLFSASGTNETDYLEYSMCDAKTKVCLPEEQVSVGRTIVPDLKEGDYTLKVKACTRAALTDTLACGVYSELPYKQVKNPDKTLTNLMSEHLQAEKVVREECLSFFDSMALLQATIEDGKTSVSAEVKKLLSDFSSSKKDQICEDILRFTEENKLQKTAATGGLGLVGEGNDSSSDDGKASSSDNGSLGPDSSKSSGAASPTGSFRDSGSSLQASPTALSDKKFIIVLVTNRRTGAVISARMASSPQGTFSETDATERSKRIESLISKQADKQVLDASLRIQSEELRKKIEGDTKTLQQRKAELNTLLGAGEDVPTRSPMLAIENLERTKLLGLWSLTVAPGKSSSPEESLKRIQAFHTEFQDISQIFWDDIHTLYLGNRVFSPDLSSIDPFASRKKRKGPITDRVQRLIREINVLERNHLGGETPFDHQWEKVTKEDWQKIQFLEKKFKLVSSRYEEYLKKMKEVQGMESDLDGLKREQTFIEQARSKVKVEISLLAHDVSKQVFSQEDPRSIEDSRARIEAAIVPGKAKAAKAAREATKAKASGTPRPRVIALSETSAAQGLSVDQLLQLQLLDSETMIRAGLLQRDKSYLDMLNYLQSLDGAKPKVPSP